MPFEILNLTAATMVSLTSRTERHGKDDSQDAGDHVADDVERNGEGATGKTPAQIRGAKGAATRRARAAA